MAEGTSAADSAATGVGAPVLRKEDRRFLTGAGRYVGDIHVAAELHAIFLRSPHGHAGIRRVVLDKARAMPGVVTAAAGADLRAAGVRDLPCARRPPNNADGGEFFVPPRPPLAVGRVRYVGEPVAVVVAGTLDQARAAAEAIEVEYDPLPAVVDIADAAKPGAPTIWQERPNNRLFRCEWGNRAAAESGFARAAHVVRRTFRNNRLIPNAMEPRAVLATRGEDGRLTVYANSQKPHDLKNWIAEVVGIAPDLVRVISPDVGGGFGVKLFLYSEETTVAWLALTLGRPVRWSGDRNEACLGDAHARDHRAEAALALDAEGRFLAIRVETLANLGAYLSSFGPSIPTLLYLPFLVGLYRIPALWAHLDGMLTNTMPVDAYRGAGRPEGIYVIERMVDEAAAELGIDPAELRRRNLIQASELPYATAGRLRYENIDPPRALAEALAASDRPGYAARKAASASRGKLRGFGFGCWVEATSGAGPLSEDGKPNPGTSKEFSRAALDPGGDVTVYMGTHGHGQGHETVFAQVMAGMLGLPLDRVKVRFGDTDEVAFGEGTYASRSMSLGGGACHGAGVKLIAEGKRIAARLLETAEPDIELEGGKFRVAGTDRAVDWRAVAAAAGPQGIGVEDMFVGKGNTFPSGCHVAEVEIDPETGVVRIDRYAGADDYGVQINPLLLEGQLHGGLAQGIGQALIEHCVYDRETGQLLTGSFMDYAMPRADDLPAFALRQYSNAQQSNPLGVKGCGEAGCIVAPVAIMNAVMDALRPEGVTVDDLSMPATPHRVWQAIQQGRARKERG
ncbi:MAG: xanthine dehydrogenase family protein molybdopterin-binding subunit [Dongiaceae bacterium]